ncbi:caspase, EACC1-associated type [Actinomadura rudentiformis]|uniref:AAA family ATPase n=1 Tax=Actinomadura rudentiformis TaxID=359158 RepID=A0A6H9YM72_9ACTN|nr:AAA domain-containing protein [Actinomadura rudentiformis]KAB2339666.1 AAA family ATPase [Actinomadura rudentiformis]
MSRTIRRKALLIGIENYEDARFAPLPSVRADVWHMQQILEHRNIGAFMSVRSVCDLTADDMRYEISEFLDDCGEDELALLYASGHGTRLVQAGGEFHFVAKDTDSERVADTGVSAGFVNELLEQCAAPQKVVLIDTCRSGGFAVGLRTADRTRSGSAKSGEESPLTSRGVYVLSSSRAGENSYAGLDTPEGAEPSAFTAELVEALRTGKVGRDGTGEVSVADLFDYVNRRMRANGARQIPVKSALGVDDRIVIATCPQGAAPQLAPLSRRPAVQRQGPGPSEPLKAPSGRVTWPDLLGYYRGCVMSDVAEPPLMSVTDHDSYVCLTGAERLLSGDLDDDHCVPAPPQATDLVQAAVAEEAELWAGYPVVVTHPPSGTGRPGTPRFAPLLVRAVEPVHVGDEIRLRPYGPVLPHPQLAKERLGDEDAAELAATYQPTWHAGQLDRMAVDVRHLLMDEYELPFVQEPRPDQLAERIDVDTPGDGARNAAVLISVPRKISATAKLLKDLEDIDRKQDRIKITALAALSPDPGERPEPPPERQPHDVRLVTPLPCNEAQAAVMVSAMTRRLTVATGPPGTGKSQLVANLVATAQASGETVLVASTNNQAVDEVCGRAHGLVEGSLVRTGSAQNRESEAATLDLLAKLGPPQHNVETARAQLTMAADVLKGTRLNLGAIASTEARLRHAGAAREEHAGALGLPVSDLHERLGSQGPLDVLARKAERAASARFLGEWRRRRFLGRLGIAVPGSGTAEGCLTVARFLHAETVWQSDQALAAGHPDDGSLLAELDAAEQGVRTASTALLDSSVRTSVRRGRTLINELLRARRSGSSDWRAVKQVLTAVRGWAVTSLSARRFPPEPALFDLVIIDEASQCAIPHVIPLLFRARRALIIGDVMQLPHIATVSAEREAMIRRQAGLRSDWLEKTRLGFRRYSAFHAAERSAAGSFLLDEHFRCHPDIAMFTNQQFYQGRLNVLTDIRNRPSLPGKQAIIWSDVPGRATRPASGSSWVNNDELRKVLDSVRYLLAGLPPDATIGVVTPFKAQADAVRDRVGHDNERVRVGTVHTFQGGERDVMIFSLVAGDGMRAGSIRWVEQQLNLWNVAITRARSHLIMVGDATLWHGRGGIAADLLQAANAADKLGGMPETTDGRQELSDRLFKALSSRNPDSTVELGGTVNGHRLDALVRRPQHNTAILLDPGPPQDGAADRHLRLMLRRRDLLNGTDAAQTAERLPAWRLYEGLSRGRPAHL